MGLLADEAIPAGNSARTSQRAFDDGQQGLWFRGQVAIYGFQGRVSTAALDPTTTASALLGDDLSAEADQTIRSKAEILAMVWAGFLCLAQFAYCFYLILDIYADYTDALGWESDEAFNRLEAITSISLAVASVADRWFVWKKGVKQQPQLPEGQTWGRREDAKDRIIFLWLWAPITVFCCLAIFTDQLSALLDTKLVRGSCDSDAHVIATIIFQYVLPSSSFGAAALLLGAECYALKQWAKAAENNVRFQSTHSRQSSDDGHDPEQDDDGVVYGRWLEAIKKTETVSRRWLQVLIVQFFIFCCTVVNLILWILDPEGGEEQIIVYGFFSFCPLVLSVYRIAELNAFFDSEPRRMIKEAWKLAEGDGVFKSAEQRGQFLSEYATLNPGIKVGTTRVTYGLVFKLLAPAMATLLGSAMTQLIPTVQRCPALPTRLVHGVVTGDAFFGGEGYEITCDPGFVLEDAGGHVLQDGLDSLSSGSMMCTYDGTWDVILTCTDMCRHAPDQTICGDGNATTVNICSGGVCTPGGH